MTSYIVNGGTPVEIRPIRPDDAPRLQVAHRRLSPESRYRRFLGAKPILSSEDVRYLVNVDGADHFALVGTVPAAHDESIVAVARFVRLREDPGAAEFAVVVGDDYQRRGLAFELLTQLAAAAVDRGITRFRATVLSENSAILKLIDRLSDGRFEARRLGDTTEVELALAGSDEWPDRADVSSAA